MFTGIIEETGRIVDKAGTAASFRLTIGAARILEDLKPGDSIAVDGVCLTVERVDRDRFTVYSSPETISRTTLERSKRGSWVNLERALTPITRISGHFVLGHVDGVGSIRSIHREADSWRISFALTGEELRYCVMKGSIAIDGISLTIAGLEERENIIQVAVIPFTYENTTLKEKRAGDPVNVETDIFARYVERFMSPRLDKGKIDENLLRNAGFIE